MDRERGGCTWQPIIKHLLEGICSRMDKVGRMAEKVACDRGTHNRSVFGSTLAKKGVNVRPAG
eukprot:9738884-Karenia_brevis.AAC.1